MNSTSVANTSLENETDSSMTVSFKAEGIAWCSAFILEAVLITVGNLLAIALFQSNKMLRKRSLFLVINMAFADLMLGALSLPLYIYYLGAEYQLWMGNVNMILNYFFGIVDSVSMVATLMTAASISGDRFYAIYWPFKHKTLSMRAYRIVICTVWTLAIFECAGFIALDRVTSNKYALYVWTAYTLIPTFIICGCNIGILRKFQQGSVALRQENRVVQNKRLTKTLLFVSVLALLSWLPLIILNCLIALHVSIPWRCRIIATILNYSNSLVNPVVYALRIPEFRQALGLCCLGRDEALNDDGGRRRNNVAAVMTLATQLRTLRTHPGHIHLTIEPDFMDTKL